VIHTDGTPTIAMCESDRLLPPPISNRDPGDEHHDRPTTELRREWTVPGTDSANGIPKEEE